VNWFRRFACVDRPLLAALLGEVFDGDEVFEQGDQDLFAGFALADVAHPPRRSSRRAGGALLVDNADLDPAWIETILIPVLADPERIAAMSAHASAAGAPDADVVLARHVLIAVAERCRFAS
jgi:hypothetical protein